MVPVARGISQVQSCLPHLQARERASAEKAGRQGVCVSKHVDSMQASTGDTSAATATSNTSIPPRTAVDLLTRILSLDMLRARLT